MENDKKEEIIKKIEYIFEPINGKFVSFEKPHIMYSYIHKIGDTKNIFDEKNKITFYPVKIKTKLGELNMSLESTYLNDLKSAISIAYSYSDFHQKYKIQDDISWEIHKRIYL